MSVMFLALCDNIPEAVFFKDLESRFLFVNRAKAEHMGLSYPEEAVGKTDFDFYDEKFAREALLDERKVMETGIPISKVEKVRYRDGRKKWVKVVKAPMRDAEGNIVGIVGISTDITELKEAEERAERYLDVAEVIICSIDMDGKITMVNRKASEISGYKPEELLGKDFVETFIPEELKPKVRQVISSLLSGNAERHKRFVNPILTKNEEQRVIEWYNTLLRDEKGGIIGLLSSGIDVTEKKHYELKLRDLAYRLNGLKPGGVFIYESHERCFKAYADLTFHGVPGLCLLRRDPEEIIEKYGINPESIRIIASRPLKGYPAIDNLQKVSLAISEFHKENMMGTILLDGLEYLISINGFDQVFRFIQEKHLDFIENKSLLLIPFNLETLQPHQKALLLSETEGLKK